jgi:hypothetical protein
LISDPSPVANTNLLFVNRNHYRVVNGLLAGRKTLRRHLYITGLIDSLVCRRCEAEEETSSHVLCECEGLTTLQCKGHKGPVKSLRASGPKGLEPIIYSNI